MFKNKIGKVGLVAGAAILATAIGSSAFASLNIVTATATDTIAVHASGTYLSAAAGAETPVISMFLPQGQYVLSASGDVVNPGPAPSDYVRCQIVVNGTQVAAVSTLVGDPNQPGNHGPSGLLSTVALTGGANVGPGGATATLQCEHDTWSWNGAAPLFDNLGSMWAHKTTSLLVANGGF